MALQRIRQLSAHEVGHTIGLSHNYISSSQVNAERYSVMDYPHPMIELDENGNVELRDAYPNGIGDWDKAWIRYGYTDFAPGTDEDTALREILMEAASEGLTFISDQDARPAGSAHPNTHLWDNGANAAAELNRMMEVRRVALDQFGEAAIKDGMPMATMEEALVPLYLHHRYQAEATSKVVAGLYYTYAMRGDGQEPLRFVPADEQWAAIEALIKTLAPTQLTIPRSILERLPPRPFRYPPHQELFPRNTGLVFDAVAPAASATDMILSFLFHPERAARLVQQKALQPDLPGLTEVIDRVVENTFRPPLPGWLRYRGKSCSAEGPRGSPHHAGRPVTHGLRFGQKPPWPSSSYGNVSWWGVEPPRLPRTPTTASSARISGGSWRGLINPSRHRVHPRHLREALSATRACIGSTGIGRHP